MSPAKLVSVFLFVSISSAYPGHGTTPENSVVPNGHINPKFTHGSYPSPGVGDGDWTHVGVDIGADCGSDVYAFADGKVLEVVKERADWRYAKGLGFAVLIKHSTEFNIWNQKPFYTLYLHLNEPPLKDVGDPVVGRQTVIGKVGNKGTKAEGTDENCHTHFEVRYFQGIEGFWHPQWGDQTESGMRLNIYGRGDQSESPLLTTYWKDPEDLFREHREGTTKSIVQEDAPVHECDKLAADPFDPNRVAPGIFQRVPRDERRIALEACKAALARYGEVPRFRFQYAKLLHWDRQYERAAALYRRLANRGYVAAQAYLGIMYIEGRGVSQDYGEATKWLGLAAEHGHALAQFILAEMYHDGNGVSQDYADAVAWYRRAAGQGYVPAQLALGGIYSVGLGRVPQDGAEAIKWYRKAAEQGQIIGLYYIGEMYFLGEGVPQDYAEAARWWHRAAEQDEPISQLRLGEMYEEGRWVPQDYDKALMWYGRAAGSGYAEGKEGVERLTRKLKEQDAIAELREQAEELRRKQKQAALEDAPVHECDKLAADPEDPNRVTDGVSGRLDERSIRACNDAISQFPGVARFEYQYARALTNVLRKGYDSLADARTYLQIAAERNYAIAQFGLGELYNSKVQETSDFAFAPKMAKWFERAAGQGYAPAQSRIGNLYEKGIGVPKDRTKAIVWYQKAASQGDLIAFFWLGYLYEREENYVKAIKWYRAGQEHEQLIERPLPRRLFAAPIHRVEEKQK